MLGAAIGLADRLRALSDWILAFGLPGVFALALVDAFVPLPGGTDLAVVVLSARDPQLAALYAALATLGAVIGATLLYLGARRAGTAVLRRFDKARRRRVETLLGRYDVAAIAVAALLPPPFPFKLFNLSAGVLEIAVPRFVAAVLIGRGVRFGVEAVLAVQFGEQALELIKGHGVQAVCAALLVGGGIWLVKYIHARRQAVQNTQEGAPS
jgi:membrane protein YqaA with SNARE-associated domain